MRLAGNAAQHLARQRSQPVTVLRIDAQGLQPACLPVHPGRITLFGRAHRIDGLHHLLPAACALIGTQGCARLPGQGVIGPAGLHGVGQGFAGAAALDARAGRQTRQALGALKLVGRVVRQPHRRLLGSGRPGPRGQVVGQVVFPARFQRVGRRLGIGRRQPHQGQRGQLGAFAFAIAGRGLVGKVACGCIQQRLQCLVGRFAGQPHRLRDGARLVGVHGQTRLAPCIGCFQHAGVDQQGGHLRAAFIGIALREPGFAGVFAHVAPREVVGDQGVAGDLAVIVHAKAREVEREVGPVAAMAQLEQPVVAQAVFDIAVLELGIKAFEVGLLQLGQPHIGIPVGDPRRQRMALSDGSFAQRCQPRTVTLAKRLACVEDGLGVGAIDGFLHRRLCGSLRQHAQPQRHAAIAQHA